MRQCRNSNFVVIKNFVFFTGLLVLAGSCSKDKVVANSPNIEDQDDSTSSLIKNELPVYLPAMSGESLAARTKEQFAENNTPTDLERGAMKRLSEVFIAFKNTKSNEVFILEIEGAYTLESLHLL